MPWIKSLLTLLGFILVCFAAAALGSLFTESSRSAWYPTLVKPAWNPPDWVFGPVWSTLYLLMAIAAWLVWRKSGWKLAAAAMILFAVQLALNVAWSAIFFGLRWPAAAMGELLVLWSAILLTMLSFFRHTPAAGYLMLPYLLWVTYAATLNFAIWRMN